MRITRLNLAARRDAPAGVKDTPAFHIRQTWHSTLAVFAAQGPAVLFWAIVGLAGVKLICLMASVSLGESLFIHTHGIFVTINGLLGVTSLFGRRMLVLLIVQTLLGFITLAIAKGAITWIALRDPHAPATQRLPAGSAFKAAGARFPALFAGTLITSALQAIIAVSLMAPLIALRFDPAQPATPYQNTTVTRGIPQAMLAQAVNLSAAAPQSAFAGFVPYWRNVTFRDQPIWTIQAPAGGQELEESLGISIKRSQKRSINTQYLAWIMALALALALTVEVLMRFNAAFAMDGTGKPKTRASWVRSLLLPVASSVKMGARHLSVMVVYAALLGAATVAAGLAFVVLPNVLAQSFALPEVARFSGQPWVTQASMTLAVAGLTVAGAIVDGFVTVCDARLYASLKSA